MQNKFAFEIEQKPKRSKQIKELCCNFLFHHFLIPKLHSTVINKMTLKIIFKVKYFKMNYYLS